MSGERDSVEPASCPLAAFTGHGSRDFGRSPAGGSETDRDVLIAADDLADDRGLDARSFAAGQRVASGDVRVRLDHGNAVVVGRRSPLSLYDKALATYEADDAFDHASAVGFIEIFGLPLRTAAARHGAVGRRYGAAWTWTEPLLEELPTRVHDAPASATK